jgi:anti-sigma regulatory factor (Ser/Thr protein kinase)
MVIRRTVPGDDFSQAGKASAELKRVLASIGVDPKTAKRAAVAMYEAEINMVIHAGGGVVEARIEGGRVVMVLEDEGPGIPDLDLAMTEGWSTAPDLYRELGFGAGMGLPNMKRNADELRVESVVGKGTKVTMSIDIRAAGAGHEYSRE